MSVSDHAASHTMTLARLKRTVRLGFKSLWLHRLRSLLTVLGIVFGVCSVIAMLAVGEGASHEAQEQIRQLGSNNIIIRSLKPTGEENTTSQRSRILEYGLTYEDIDIIRKTIPGVRILVPARVIREYVWRHRNRLDSDIYGTVPWYPEMRNQRVVAGRYFSDIEMEGRRNVCVIGSEMVDDLFPIDSPIGKNVRVGSDYFQIIGVMEERGSGPEVANQPKDTQGPASATADAAAYRMFIPLTAARHRFGETLMKRRTGSFEAEKVELHEVTVQVANQEAVVEVAAIIREILERNHKQPDFDIIVPLELLRQAERTTQIFNIVLGAIAAISLLVGGIGIMNIMLASVTERTREIGIRRALGAKRRDIIIQFLVETVILSGSGGLLGVLLGVTIPFFITYFAGMDTIVTLWSPLIAFTISGLVGVVFGIYPALRAADMDPVEALRHE